MRSLTVKSIILLVILFESSVLFASDDSPRAFYSIPVHTIINSNLAYNPISGIAPIAFQKNQMGLSYANRYLLKETNSFLGFGTYTTKYASICLSANYFGNQTFWFSNQSIIIAKKLSDKFSIGVAFSHTGINQGQFYSSIHSFSPSVGISYIPLKKWKISTALKNISHKQNTSTGFNHFILGVSYIIKNVSFHTQIEKMQNSKTQVNFLGEYDLKKKVCFLLRTSTGYEPLSLGVECKISGISFLFLYSYHTLLGSSPEVTMYKRWEK